jgi:hypothetical protein
LAGTGRRRLRVRVRLARCLWLVGLWHRASRRLIFDGRRRLDRISRLNRLRHGNRGLALFRLPWLDAAQPVDRGCQRIGDRAGDELIAQQRTGQIERSADAWQVSQEFEHLAL